MGVRARRRRAPRNDESTRPSPARGCPWVPCASACSCGDCRRSKPQLQRLNVSFEVPGLHGAIVRTPRSCGSRRPSRRDSISLGRPRRAPEFWWRRSQRDLAAHSAAAVVASRSTLCAVALAIRHDRGHARDRVHDALQRARCRARLGVHAHGAGCIRSSRRCSAGSASRLPVRTRRRTPCSAACR